MIDVRPRRWGLPFDTWTMADLRRRALAAMTTRTPLRLADVNVAKLVALTTDSGFRQAVLDADAVVVDGMGVVWGLRLSGVDVPERLSGIDLLDEIVGLCAANGLRPFVVGARPQVVERAVAELARRHPGLQLAGWRDGYFGADSDMEVAAAIRESGADCLIAALPYPRQDLFLARVHAASGAALAFGVGGSLDVVAGDRRRAPPWMRAVGLEWFFRLIQEPLRLGPRYLFTNLRFLGLLLAEMARRRR